MKLKQHAFKGLSVTKNDRVSLMSNSKRPKQNDSRIPSFLKRKCEQRSGGSAMFVAYKKHMYNIYSRSHVILCTAEKISIDAALIFSQTVTKKINKSQTFRKTIEVSAKKDRALLVARSSPAGT